MVKLSVALLSVLLGLAGLVLAWHYPLGPIWAVGSFAIVTCLAFGNLLLAIALVPALLPVIGLAPWTGWLSFEEFDLLVLAVTAGGYARIAFHGNLRTSWRNTSPNLPSLWLLMVILFAASVLVAMVRGFGDAGGFQFGWFQGYHESMNSVRLAKSFFLALLLFPVWQHVQRQRPAQSACALTLGLTAGLTAASLATIWERLAFTDLLNFSADYRTTGLFWEMHVGGAALDGFLVLTVPFAVRGLLQARTPVRWSLLVSVAGLAGYACLTTFSRGVFLAIPLGLFVFFALQAMQQRRKATSAEAVPSNRRSYLVFMLLVASFGLLAAWMFPTGGYRGIGALLGTVALILLSQKLLRQLTSRQWISGAVGGLSLIMLFIGSTWFLPRGAYITYALAFSFSAGSILLYQRGRIAAGNASVASLAGLVATAMALVIVARNWGGPAALWPATAAAAFCSTLIVLARTARLAVWPDTRRWQAGVLFFMCMTAGIVAVFSGGAYMGDRFASGAQDLQSRLDHWRLTANLLQTRSDWWLGKGTGRFPATYFLLADPKQHPGDVRLLREEANNYVRLAGGQYNFGTAEPFLMSQRVSLPSGQVRVTAKVRTAMAIRMYFNICEKHLLYFQSCVGGKAELNPAGGQWQLVDINFPTKGISRGHWYAPKLLAFSITTDTNSGVADLDDIVLVASDGKNLLSNGDFSAEMAQWYFSSDRHHMPWHAKNVFMHVFFEQGIVGLALWCSLVCGALGRLAVGRAKNHPLAPAVAASLVGFMIVGLFDSLLDVPRVATLFYVLLLSALAMRPPTLANHNREQQP